MLAMSNFDLLLLSCEFEPFRPKTLSPNCTQAEGFILGVGAKMFSCCGARCAPWQQSAYVAHRPRPLARLLPPATGGSRLAPHRRTGYRLRRICQRSIWIDLLDNHIILTARKNTICGKQTRLLTGLLFI